MPRQDFHQAFHDVGSSKVQDGFSELLGTILGPYVIKEWKQNNLNDWLITIMNFQKKVEEFDENNVKGVSIAIPTSLAACYLQVTGRRIMEALSVEWKIKQVSFTRGFLNLPHSLMIDVIMPVITSAVEHIKNVIDRVPRAGNSECIVIVGDLAKCSAFKAAVINSFGNKHIICPKDPTSCVMKGAVLYGHRKIKMF